MAETQVVTTDWDQFRETLRENVTPVTWQTWLRPLSLHSSEERLLTLAAPSEFHLRWVADKYEGVISEAVKAVFGPDTELEMKAVPRSSVETTLEDEAQADETPALEGAWSPRPIIPTPSMPTRLVPKYRFEDFVVGPSNRFAHAAMMAVSEQPGMHYNPLFIYGGAGLGKTHLLNAVGHHAFELHRCTVRYVSSEGFFNEFIDGIRRKKMDEFKTRYRTTDVLLLDDVQFFEGKEQILEEFFHTFNSLYESGKQMVISSDRHPRHISTLEDRLRSRFEWGLLTDVQPPDVETRLAILRKNAESAPTPIPHDVLQFIAEQVSDNIRELEGALTRVTAYTVLTGQPASLPMAQDVLQDLLPSSGPRPLTPADIISATAAAYGFQPRDLESPSRRAPLVLARQVAMYLCRDLTDLSLPKIGALFGGRDHTTVMYAVDKVKRLIQTDHEVFENVTALSQGLRKT